jgi:hypothetical protein
MYPGPGRSQGTTFPPALEVIEPAATRRQSVRQGNDHQVFQRALMEDPADPGRQQIQRDDGWTSGGGEPPLDFFGDHERAELQGRCARQPGGLQGEYVFREVGQQQTHEAAGPGAQVGQGNRQGLRPGYELAVGEGPAEQGAGRPIGKPPGGGFRQGAGRDLRVGKSCRHSGRIGLQPIPPREGGSERAHAVAASRDFIGATLPAAASWPCGWRYLGLADGALLADLGPPPLLAGLHVELALAQLLGDPAALQEFLEAAQGQANGFALVDAHSQRHACSWKVFRRG